MAYLFIKKCGEKKMWTCTWSRTPSPLISACRPPSWRWSWDKQIYHFTGSKRLQKNNVTELIRFWLKPGIFKHYNHRCKYLWELRTISCCTTTYSLISFCVLTWSIYAWWSINQLSSLSVVLYLPCILFDQMPNEGLLFPPLDEPRQH